MSPEDDRASVESCPSKHVLFRSQTLQRSRRGVRTHRQKSGRSPLTVATTCRPSHGWRRLVAGEDRRIPEHGAQAQRLPQIAVGKRTARVSKAPGRSNWDSACGTRQGATPPVIRAATPRDLFPLCQLLSSPSEYDDIPRLGERVARPGPLRAFLDHATRRDPTPTLERRDVSLLRWSIGGSRENGLARGAALLREHRWSSD